MSFGFGTSDCVKQRLRDGLLLYSATQQSNNKRGWDTRSLRVRKAVKVRQTKKLRGSKDGGSSGFDEVPQVYNIRLKNTSEENGFLKSKNTKKQNTRISERQET